MSSSVLLFLGVLPFLLKIHSVDSCLFFVKNVGFCFFSSCTPVFFLRFLWVFAHFLAFAVLLCWPVFFESRSHACISVQCIPAGQMLTFLLRRSIHLWRLGVFPKMLNLLEFLKKTKHTNISEHLLFGGPCFLELSKSSYPPLLPSTKQSIISVPCIFTTLFELPFLPCQASWKAKHPTRPLLLGTKQSIIPVPCFLEPNRAS